MSVPQPPSSDLLERLDFREEARGANLWLVDPNDEGLVHGTAGHHGVACVHPMQAYLDLKDQPERAKEAAEHLRANTLNWSTHG